MTQLARAITSLTNLRCWKPFIIGIDLDNTIVSYNDLFFRQALSMGLVGPSGPRDKTELRNFIKSRFHDLAWRKVQARVYGPGMAQSEPSPGVREFLHLCMRRGAKVYVVSHKTEFAAFDETRTHLHRASLEWMWRRGLLDSDYTGLQKEDVFFEATREEKIRRISQLGCSHFIDDLQEVLLDEGFDRHVKKILYAPGGNEPLKAAKVLSSWQEIADHVFGH